MIAVIEELLLEASRTCIALVLGRFYADIELPLGAAGRLNRFSPARRTLVDPLSYKPTISAST
jgi:hypothetical protein